MRLQVSEIGKIGLLFCQRYLAMHRRSLDAWKEGFMYPFSLLGIFVGLIFWSQIMHGFSLWFSRRCLFVSGIKLRYLLPSAGLALLYFV